MWIENEYFFIEDVKRNTLLPLHSSHLAWFEDSFVALMHGPSQDTSSNKSGMILVLVDSKIQIQL